MSWTFSSLVEMMERSQIKGGRMSGIERIAVERQRQIEVEGWTLQHDYQEHGDGDLQSAARCYAILGLHYKQNQYPVPSEWPWEPEWWKPSTDPIKNFA